MVYIMYKVKGVETMMTLKELKQEIETLNDKPFNYNEPRWEQEFFEISDGVYVCKTEEKNVFYLHTNDAYGDYYTTNELIDEAREMEWIEEEKKENEEHEEMELIKARIVKQIMEDIDNLKSVSFEEIEDGTASCHHLYADFFVYKAEAENKYYFECIENNNIDIISKEKLVKIVTDNWAKI